MVVFAPFISSICSTTIAFGPFLLYEGLLYFLVVAPLLNWLIDCCLNDGGEFISLAGVFLELLGIEARFRLL